MGSFNGKLVGDFHAALQYQSRRSSYYIFGNLEIFFHNMISRDMNPRLYTRLQRQIMSRHCMEVHVLAALFYKRRRRRICHFGVLNF